MLATSITAQQAVKRLDDVDYLLQQKLDGHRLIAIRSGDGLSMRNRAGNHYSKSVPQAITNNLMDLPGRVALDGELVEHTYWIFDILEFGGDVRGRPYIDRYRLLNEIKRVWNPGEDIQFVPSLWSAFKNRAFRHLRRGGAEGVIFRNAHSPYLPGIRSPELQKFKFVNTVDCVVLEVGREGKDSLRLALFDTTGEPYEVGACSMIGKDPTVKVGDVVEVRYLYTGSNGRLYQPHFERKRDDKPPEQCTNEQLHHVSKKVCSIRELLGKIQTSV